MPLADKYEKLMVLNSTSNTPFFLILDGANEMIDSSYLASELRIWNSFPNVSIIVSSRNNEFYNIADNDKYEYKRILPLSENAVLDYLGRKDIDDKITPLVNDILNIPQMLALYVGTSSAQKKYYNVKGLDWREPRSISDIIHNYFICQIAESVFEKHLCSLYEAVLTIQYILPSISWNIYLQNNNVIEIGEVLHVIKNEISNVIEKGETQAELPIILELTHNVGERINTNDVVSLIIDHLTLLDEYDYGRYIFVHQNFFEYLVSVYWKNMAERKIDSYSDDVSWNNEILPTFAEQYFSDTDGNYIKSDMKIFNALLDKMRNQTLTVDDYSLFNLIRIFNKKNNWSLSKVDFSRLDLRNISLNGSVLSDDNNGAMFCGALISNITFSPQGHHAAIVQVFFFSQNPGVLYTRDLHGVIGLYDLQTDKRIKTIKNHMLSGSEKIIIAASTPEIFVIPDKYTFLEERLLGIINVYVDETEQKEIGPGRLHPFKDKLIAYNAFIDKWIIKSGNNIYISKGIEDIGDTNCAWKLSEDERFFRIIENANHTVMLLQLLSNKDEEIKEIIIRFDFISDTKEAIYSGKIILGGSNVFLSDDGSILAITNGCASVTIINVEDFTISQELSIDDRVETRMNGFVSISPDNQWCVWIGPISVEVYPFKVFIWNLWKSDIKLAYEYNDIISSHCFTLDSKCLILGIFNGTIDSIDLRSYEKHHIAIGHRVDQKLFNVDGKLVVRRSDGYYQMWDIVNKKVVGKHLTYSFPMQNKYSITSSGKYWYSIIMNSCNDCLEIWDASKQERYCIDLFKEGERLLSNAVEDTVIEVNYQNNNLSEIFYYLYSFDSKPAVSDIKRISLPEFANSYGYLKKIHFTCQKKYLVIVLSQVDNKEIVKHIPHDMGRPWVLVWDLDNNCKKSLFKFDEKTLYMDQKYEICSCGEKILICFYYPISFYIIDTQQDDYMKHYNTSYMPVRLRTTRPENEIQCISIKQKEDKTQIPSGLLIAPDGTVVTDMVHGRNIHIFDSEKNNVPVGSMQISVGKAMCCNFITENVIGIGCESGVVLLVEYNDDESYCLALNESDFRVQDVIVMSNDEKKYLLAAQKDDNIYIWDLDTMSYVGYLRSIPGTDIYNCDFRNAVFESKEIESLVKMNGGIV